MSVDTATIVDNPTYAKLIALLEASRARYRLIDHPPEGVTAIASRLRDHDVAQAAKSIVTRVRLSKRSSRYVLAVVPGDRRVDFGRIGRMYGGTEAAFASTTTAERLAGSASGTIVPFTFTGSLALVADPALLRHPVIYFNAARLDRSIELNTDDYVALTRPCVASIGTVA